MSKQESEIVFVCKIGDFEGLKEAASVIEMAQLKIRIPGKGVIRVRKSTDADGTVYEAGLKGQNKNPNSTVKKVPETEDPVSPAYFEHFREFAESMETKKRHIFPGTKSTVKYKDREIEVPPVVYEVDVALRHDGRESEWCKVDVDITDILKILDGLDGDEVAEWVVSIDHLPFKPQMAFIVGDESEEQKALLQGLWADEWVTDPYGKPLKPVEGSVSKLSSATDAGAGDQNVQTSEQGT